MHQWSRDGMDELNGGTELARNLGREAKAGNETLENSVRGGLSSHFQRYGLVAALVFCVVTDFAAAFAIKGISMRAGVETLIIALFVLLCVKLV
ncbi:MAG: hypothetical protein J7K81_05295 [Methanophagales archaeon]|nr:hypothetical protein [Methanophagales archaeon]